MGAEQHQRVILPAAPFILALLLLTACHAQPTTQEQPGMIEVESVQVVPLSHIEFDGQSTLPDGACLVSQLDADGMPETWWPADACAVIERRQWHIRVQLGNHEVPQELSMEKQYVLRVWERGNPSIEAEPFWFDLSGPPVSQE